MPNSLMKVARTIKSAGASGLSRSCADQAKIIRAATSALLCALAQRAVLREAATTQVFNEFRLGVPEAVMTVLGPPPVRGVGPRGGSISWSRTART